MNPLAPTRRNPRLRVAAAKGAAQVKYQPCTIGENARNTTKKRSAVTGKGAGRRKTGQRANRSMTAKGALIPNHGPNRPRKIAGISSALLATIVNSPGGLGHPRVVSANIVRQPMTGTDPRTRWTIACRGPFSFHNRNAPHAINGAEMIFTAAETSIHIAVLAEGALALRTVHHARTNARTNQLSK